MRHSAQHNERDLNSVRMKNKFDFNGSSVLREQVEKRKVIRKERGASCGDGSLSVLHAVACMATSYLFNPHSVHRGGGVQGECDSTSFSSDATGFKSSIFLSCQDSMYSLYVRYFSMSTSSQNAERCVTHTMGYLKTSVEKSIRSATKERQRPHTLSFNMILQLAENLNSSHRALHHRRIIFSILHIRYRLRAVPQHDSTKVRETCRLGLLHR